jgi:hypothetical protein
MQVGTLEINLSKSILLFTSNSHVRYKTALVVMEQIEAYRQIVQLQSEIVKISARNADLKRKCSDLEDELTRKQSPQENEITEVLVQEVKRPTVTLFGTCTRYAARIIDFIRPPGKQPA